MANYPPKGLPFESEGLPSGEPSAMFSGGASSSTAERTPAHSTVQPQVAAEAAPAMAGAPIAAATPAPTILQKVGKAIMDTRGTPQSGSGIHGNFITRMKE